jgi:hypothetical protein
MKGKSGTYRTISQHFECNTHRTYLRLLVSFVRVKWVVATVAAKETASRLASAALEVLTIVRGSSYRSDRTPETLPEVRLHCVRLFSTTAFTQG